MRGDLLDIVLLVAAALFAISGYRQGFLVGALSFGGFLLGGLVGALAGPPLSRTAAFRSIPSALFGLAVVFLLAGLGQVVGGFAGAQLRRRVTALSARKVDAAGGALVSVLSLLLVAWLLGSALQAGPFPAVASQVRRSAVIAGVDAVLPRPARVGLEGFKGLIDENGFPSVFGDFAPTQPVDVAPPDPALAASQAVRTARPDILKVVGEASCARLVSGSGFVFAPERVMTNAHVVAGVGSPTVLVGDRRLPARTVLYDPRKDVAVLYVPGLGLDPLPFFQGVAKPNTGAIVAGYPLGGPFRADAARVGEVQEARGPDIYGSGTVTRQIYSIRGQVQKGNSGGPLLDAQGQVLGVVFAAAADRDNVGFVLTGREIAPDVVTGRTAVREVDTQGCD